MEWNGKGRADGWKCEPAGHPSVRTEAPAGERPRTGVRPDGDMPAEGSALICADCGVPLTPDDIGATRKLLDSRAKEFFCVPCLAMELGVTEKLLREKIEYFRMTGCIFFR